MKTLHLPVAYLPWIVGGREVYCHSLCQSLQALGIEASVAIHQHLTVDEPLGRHWHEGVRVDVLSALPDFGNRQTGNSKVYHSLPGFEALLDELKPDLVHFHDQGGGASLSHLRTVKQRGISAVITYHSPGQTCPQGELMRYGRIPCDGQVRLHRCTACRLTSSGIPQGMAHLAALTEWPGVDPWASSTWHRVLSRRRVTRLFRDSLREFTDLADAVVVLADWCEKLWLSNGTPPEKLHLIRTGGRAPWRGRPGAKYPDRSPLKIACLGRCTRVKGFHVLVEAVKKLSAEAPVEVHFLGPHWDVDPYGRELQKRIECDPRFQSPRLVANAQLLPVLAEMDVVVIPSLWLETGPLALFDAFAAGLPVIGSRLGGLCELVQEGENGWLFEPGNVDELAALLTDILAGGGDLRRLRGNVRPQRTIADVAADHALLYEGLTAAPDPGTLQ